MEEGKQYLFSKHFYRTPEIEDTILVRDRVYDTEGNYKTRFFAVENYKRPYYITKPVFRNHKQKKESESLAKLDKYYSTQSDLPLSINNNIKVAFRPIMRDIKKSPYLYDVDTDVSIFVANGYKDKYPEHQKNTLRVCSFDIETDVSKVTDTPDSVIMISMAMGNKAYVGVLKSLFNGMSEIDIQKSIRDNIDKYLKDNIKDKEIIIKVYNTEGGLIKNTFQGLHKWDPDILNIFNMDFDIPKIVDAAKRNDLRLVDLFHSPKLDAKYKFFKYIPGANVKKKSDGTVSSIPFQQRWHQVRSSAGFEVLDSMCAYRQVRSQKQELVNYKLDTILGIELGSRKLSFKETDKYSGLEWHIVMQTTYPSEYAAYAIYDSIGLQELDDKTFDLKFTLYNSLDGQGFNAVPRQSQKAYHMYREHIRLKGLVPGCSYVIQEAELNKMSAEEKHVLGIDGMVLDTDDWIVTVPAANNVDLGLKLLKGCPHTHTGLRNNDHDDDIKAAYPSTIGAFNTSKPTTAREVIGIGDIDENFFRGANSGVLLGPSYRTIYPIEMLGYPSYSELNDILDKRNI